MTTLNPDLLDSNTRAALNLAADLTRQFGKPVLMRDDWKRVFEPAEIAASIQRIT